ncbi:hypothetical protein AAKU55_004817 [Oxalobacteraceae bacterium GrIS 1.11]
MSRGGCLWRASAQLCRGEAGLSGSQAVFFGYFNGGSIMADSPATIIPKSKLQSVLKHLLDGVTDEDLQKLQAQSDELEAEAAAGGHHDHDHPTLE